MRCAAEPVPLKAGLDADLRGVADAVGHFAGEHGADKFVAAGMAQDEGSAGLKLATTGQQNNVLQEFQRAVARAVLIVDVAIDVIRIRQVNQLGARLEVTVVPAVEAQTGIDARGRVRSASPDRAA